jgi:hypothetical protein
MFILVGVQAFGVPGSFGAIVNSMFPVGKNYSLKYYKHL